MTLSFDDYMAQADALPAIGSGGMLHESKATYSGVYIARAEDGTQSGGARLIVWQGARMIDEATGEIIHEGDGR